MILVDLTHMIGIVLGAGLSLIIGIEREYFAKAAGMRTYALVGMGSAVFTVISKYGFGDILAASNTGFDGGRVAAQVVSGIGFLGAGLIFVRRDSVRGLTTAAGIWFVAAVGMAAGADMYLVATLVTVLYLILMVGLRPLSTRIPRARSTMRKLTITYADGKGILRDIMEALTNLGVKVLDLHVVGSEQRDGQPFQSVHLEVEGMVQALDDMSEELGKLRGVVAVDREA